MPRVELGRRVVVVAFLACVLPALTYLLAPRRGLHGAEAELALEALVSFREPVRPWTVNPSGPCRLVAAADAADTGELLAERDGIRLWSVPRTELELNLALLEGDTAHGDGGGGDVAGLRATQIAYSDPINGNVVFLLWTENTSNNPGGAGRIDISLDGQVTGSVPALADFALPGRNSIRLTGLSPGMRRFGVQGVGPAMEVSHTVVELQPFVDPTDLQCVEGERNPGPPPLCELILSWSRPEPAPNRYGIVVDGRFELEIPGTAISLTLQDLTPTAPGERHCAILAGILRLPEGAYRGAIQESCCELPCNDAPCDPPIDLVTCQIIHDPGDANVVRANWRNGELSYATGIDVFRDGAKQNSVPFAGNTAAAIFRGVLPAGEHTFGIQGDCGDPAGKSSVTEQTLTVLPATPHTRPIKGNALCSFDPDLGRTTAIWDNEDPSVFIDVYLLTDGVLRLAGSLAGGASSVTLEGTTSPEQVIVLQFFAFFPSGCHGSTPRSCVFPSPPTGNQTIRGICNGVGSVPQITSAIFGLGYLFLGTETPPCLAACDADDNDKLEITDMVYILSFLFSGGPAPPTWNGDTPTCETLPVEECAATNEACT